MEDCSFLSPEMNSFMENLEASVYEDGIPYKGVFELTARCNFNCKMCYIHMTDSQIKSLGRELTTNEWLEIARQARDAGMLYLNLTGGEIFVRPDFRELYEAFSEMGFLIQLQSNGYLIDKEVMEWLSKKPPYAIRFTLYGTSNETYEAVCGIKDGFDRVDRAVDLILKAGIPFYLVSTVVKENAGDLRSMYEYAYKKRVSFQHSTRVVKPIRGATANAKEHSLSLEDIPREAFKDVKRVKRMYKKYSSALEMCGSYRKSFWLTWDGRMQLCTFTEKPSVEVVGRPFADAWRELLCKLEKLELPKKCNDCKYEGFCQKCPGVLSAECGAPDKTCSSFCNQAKLMYEIYYDENA